LKTLADMTFEDLQAGMMFSHRKHGEQVILDLGRNKLGPVIEFHNCSIYNGKPPLLDEEDEEQNIFQAIAQNTFPYGAEGWEFLGLIEDDDVAVREWRWLDEPCPHCGYVHRLLIPDTRPEHKRCRKCGWHPSTL